MLEQACRPTGHLFLTASLQWAHRLPLPRSFSHAHAMADVLCMIWRSQSTLTSDG